MCIEVPTAVTSASRRAGYDRLTAFFGEELGVPPELLTEPGVHVVTGPKREEPCWCDFRLPFLMIGHGNSTVISVTRSLMPRISSVLDSSAARITTEAVRAMQAVVSAAHPGVKCLAGRALYCEPEDFEPFDGHATEKLLPHHPDWDDFREHFDGPVFVVRAPDGDVAAWAAIKLKSDDVWEVAVTTEKRRRGRGLAKVVVSAATQHILECGRVPLYVHDDGNLPSARVARALGYGEFGREAFCSLSQTSLTGMW